MSRKLQWLLETYLLLYLIYVAVKVIELFDPDSSIKLYYTILEALHPRYVLGYALYALHVAFSAIHVLPTAFFTFRVKFLRTSTWKLLFCLRMLFDVLGQSYEIKQMISIYHASFWTGLKVTVAVIGLLAPSYYICYLYAFRREKFLKDTRRPKTRSGPDRR